MKEGETVRYIGCSEHQIRWGNCKDPRHRLIEKGLYMVERLEVHTQHTKVWLEHFDGPFNSVCFEEG